MGKWLVLNQNILNIGDSRLLISSELPGIFKAAWIYVFELLGCKSFSISSIIFISRNNDGRLSV